MIANMETADVTQSLVAEAQAGSQTAFAELVGQCHRPLRSYLGRFVHNAEVADDLAQETFLIAYARLDAYQPSAPFLSWLFGIGRNLARTYLRKEVRRRRHEGQLVESALAKWHLEAVTHSADIDRHEQQLEALTSCVDHLPEKQRALVEQFYFQQQSAESIAIQSASKGSTIRMTLLRIRRALADCVANKMKGS